MNAKLLIVGIVLFVLLSGCVKETPTSDQKGYTAEELIAKAECGNGRCELSENCNSCADCKCSSDEDCVDSICKKKEICGDDICTSAESSTCCDDCKCSGELVCNGNTHQCMSKSGLSEEEARAVAEKYIADNKVQGSIKSVSDEYYKEEIVKQVNIDCTTNPNFVCMTILYIDNSGKIVEVLQTA